MDAQLLYEEIKELGEPDSVQKVGRPRYRVGETVYFTYGKENAREVYGTVEWVDDYGTLGQEKEVSYFKKSERLKSEPINIFSWKHYVFYESSKIQCDTKFSNDNLNNLIDELNHLFVINKDTIDTTKKILSRYGIKFIIVSIFLISSKALPSGRMPFSTIASLTISSSIEWQIPLT